MIKKDKSSVIPEKKISEFFGHIKTQIRKGDVIKHNYRDRIFFEYILPSGKKILQLLNILSSVPEKKILIPQEDIIKHN